MTDYTEIGAVAIDRLHAEVATYARAAGYDSDGHAWTDYEGARWTVRAAVDGDRIRVAVASLRTTMEIIVRAYEVRGLGRVIVALAEAVAETGLEVGMLISSPIESEAAA